MVVQQRLAPGDVRSVSTRFEVGHCGARAFGRAAMRPLEVYTSGPVEARVKPRPRATSAVLQVFRDLFSRDSYDLANRSAPAY
jgi:hypothetical protein